MSEQGLHEKYEVYKDGEQQSGCFVLKPASDPAARAALRTYATETENEDLADDIDELLARLEAMEETELSNSFVGESYQTGTRTEPRPQEPKLREKLSHWFRFYVTYEKPCGCAFWCSRKLVHPEDYEETQVLGSRTVIEEKRVYSNRVEERTKEVAVCRCTRCGDQFEAYIPHSKWAHNYPKEDESDEDDVEGEWPGDAR